MHVLRYPRECPEIMTETFYDEVVTVRNGIALVERDHVMRSLSGPYGYEYIGEIKEGKELNQLLDKVEKSKVKAELSLSVEMHTIKIEDLLIEKEKPAEPKSYLDNLS